VNSDVNDIINSNCFTDIVLVHGTTESGNQRYVKARADEQVEMQYIADVEHLLRCSAGVAAGFGFSAG
jgi:hypothetical protein